MPTYDVSVGGVDYEVDAPDETKAWEYANYTHRQSKATTPVAPVAPTEDVNRLQVPIGSEPTLGQEVMQASAPAIRGALPALGTMGAGAAVGALIGGVPTAGIGAIPGAALGAVAAEVSQIIGDPLVTGINKLFGTRLATPTEGWETLMDHLDIPKSSTEGAKLVEAITRGGAGAFTAIGAGKLLQEMTSPIAKAIGTALASGPSEQIAGGMSAGAVGEGARYGAEKLGLGETGQQVAQGLGSIAGAFTGAAVASPRRFEAPRIQVPGMTQAGVEQTVNAANVAGRRVFTSDVFPPETGMQRRLQGASEGTILGTAGERAAQQEQRIGMVQDVLSQFGAGVNREFAANIAQDINQVKQNRISFFTNQKDSVIDRISASVPPLRSPEFSNVFTSIAEEVDALNRINRVTNAPVVDKLMNFGRGLLGEPIIDSAGNVIGHQGISLRAAEENLKGLKQLLSSDQTLAHVKTPLEKIGNSIYGALAEDIKGVIRAAEGPASVAQYTTANARLSQGMNELKSASLKAILNKGDVVPEVIEKALFSQKPSEVRLINASLSPAGRANARAAILSKAASDSLINNEISTAKFQSALTKYSRQVGVLFDPADRQVVDGLSSYLRLTQRAEKFNIDPQTGARNLMPMAAGALLHALGLGKAVLAAGGLGVLSRIFESGPTRTMLMTLPRLRNNSDEQISLIKRIAESMSAAESSHSAEASRNQQLTFLPESTKKETIGAGFSETDDKTGYRVFSKDKKTFGLYGPDNQRIGIFRSQEEARKRAEKEFRKRK